MNCSITVLIDDSICVLNYVGDARTSESKTTMVKKTPNHGLHRYSQGEPNWTHSPDMQTIEERLVIRDKESNLENYTPYQTATFVATDTNVVYDGSGESWQLAQRGFEGIEVESINHNRVYDTGGRYHGELTGSKDAKVVIDAIDDRTNRASVVVPDPGPPLEWEQQVDLPLEENFNLCTIGMPQLRFSSGFSGSAAINRPGSTQRNDAKTGLRIGNFHFDDRSDEVLERAIILDDIKDSYIAPCKFYDVPGILFKASHGTTNQNYVDKPFARSTRGPLVEMEKGNPTNDNPEPDQNWIVAPSFSDKNNFTETAYIDRGRGNTWAWVRCEQADVVFEAANAREYKFIEGQLDRGNDYTHVIKESGDMVSGMVELDDYDHYASSEFTNVNTNVRAGDRIHRITEPVRFEDATNASSLQSIGLKDSSSGGNAGLSNGRTRPSLRLTTNGRAGSYAEARTGDYNSFDPVTAPKFFSSIRLNSGQSGLIARVGFYGGSSDYAELIYDPTNRLGTGISSWFLRVKTNGNVRGTEDINATPDGSGTDFVLQRLERNQSSGDARWVAHSGGENRTEIRNDGRPIDDFDFRAFVETTDGNNKAIQLDGGTRKLLMST